MGHTGSAAHSPDHRGRRILSQVQGVILWEADPLALRLSSVSEYAETLLGYPIKTWGSEAGFLQHHVHPDDWPRLVQSLYRAAAEAGLEVCEHRMFRADGTTLWVQTSVHQGLLTPSGRVLHGVTVDISSVKQAEAALRAGEENCRLLVQNLREYAVFMVSPEGRLATWNAGAERLKGYRAEEILGAPLARLFPLDEAARHTPEHLLSRALAEGQAEYEGWLLHKDAGPFWAHLSLRTMQDAQGRLLGFSNVARDLTEQERTQRRLRQSEEHFRRLVESLQEYGVFMTSPEGVVESWNRGAQRLTGHRTHDVVGAPISQLMPEEEVARQTHQAVVERAARVGTADYEGWLVRKGGARFWALMTLSAIEDNTGRLRGFSTVVRDLSERKRTEQALRESEEHFRLLVESIQDHAVFMVSADGVVESWNRGAQRLNGARAQQVVGAPIQRFFPPEEVEKATPQNLLAQARQDGTASYEGWLMRNNGNRFWANMTLNAVEDEEGRLRGFSNVARDLTERKRTEETLRESEEHMRLLFESLHDYGVFMVSPDGRVASWNAGSERLKGHRADEAIGAPLSVFFPPEAVERGLPEQLLQRARTEGRAEYEGWLLRKNASPFWATLILNAVRDAQGRLRGFSNIARDLTPRMRIERAQRFMADVAGALASSLDYRATLDTVARLVTRELAQCCVVSMVVNNTIQPLVVAHADPAKERTLRQALGTTPTGLGIPRGASYVIASGQAELYPDVTDGAWLGDALRVEDPQVLLDLGTRSYMCVPINTRGIALGAITLISSAPGRRYSHDDLLLAKELGRRAALAVDNARLYEQAQHAVALREDVLAVVSHDLRNPLSVILMAVQQLQRTAGESTEAGKAAEIIQRASLNMRHLIRDLLDFSSVEAGRFTVDLRPHDVRVLVAEVAEMFQPIAAEKNIRLETQIDGAEPPGEMRFDRERILQVFSNLLGNALKFTGPGGAVTLGVKAGRDMVELSVADTGPGISAQELPHIFDRYWQARRCAREGSGLGLAIAKGIIEAHGGTLHAESTVGVGTTFLIRLPRGRGI